MDGWKRSWSVLISQTANAVDQLAGRVARGGAHRGDVGLEYGELMERLVGTQARSKQCAT